jgi:chromosome segregation ATPase
MVKKKIGNFMAQQFSLSRKLCQSDKQSIENFITEQIREVQRQCHQKVCEVRDHRRLNDDVQKWLQETCRKLERRLGRVNHRDTTDGCFFDGKSSIKDLEDNIHYLTEQYHKLENEVKKCFSLLGENNENYSLAFQVESVLAEKKKLKKEIKKLAQENELMVCENYDLSTAKQKFQQASSYKEVELEVKDRQIKVLQIEKYDLKKEIDRLQKQHMQHVEKERTLLNLQQMVLALKEKNDDLTDETEHLKNKVHEEVKRNSPRRSTSIPKNSRINNPKYKSPRKKTRT